MHPDLEDFLEDALAGIEPTSDRIGRVVVEPDYNVAPDAQDRDALARELAQALRGQDVSSEVAISDRHPTLKKYLRRIALHPEPVEGAWVEVAPPGNWI